MDEPWLRERWGSGYRVERERGAKDSPISVPWAGAGAFSVVPGAHGGLCESKMEESGREGIWRAGGELRVIFSLGGGRRAHERREK